MTISMEYRWNYIDSERPKYSEKCPVFQYHFVNHKPYMVWPVIEGRPPL